MSHSTITLLFPKACRLRTIFGLVGALIVPEVAGQYARDGPLG